MRQNPPGNPRPELCDRTPQISPTKVHAAAPGSTGRSGTGWQTVGGGSTGRRSRDRVEDVGNRSPAARSSHGFTSRQRSAPTRFKRHLTVMVAVGGRLAARGCGRSGRSAGRFQQRSMTRSASWYADINDGENLGHLVRDHRAPPMAMQRNCRRATRANSLAASKSCLYLLTIRPSGSVAAPIRWHLPPRC